MTSPKSTDPTEFVLWSEEELKHRLETLEREANGIKKELRNRHRTTRRKEAKCGLTLMEITRYSRQLLLPELSVKSQVKLKKSSVLIVGAGGLGCPAAMYLAAAGVGRIGVADHDVVDLTNLHRQVLHTENTVGVPKAESIKQYLTRLNSGIEVNAYVVPITSLNAMDLVKTYDVVLDASDNVATRYLLNDACVIAGKPLVSGSALRFEGQLTVYNYPPGKGPTYRCLFPVPPPAHAVTNCSDGGILGAVTGVIGCLQAIESVKVIVQVPELEILSGKLLIFDGTSGRFRCVKLRGRKQDSQPTALIDYEQFCGSAATDKDKPLEVLKLAERLNVSDYQRQYLAAQRDHLLLDVRTQPEMEICKLENATNVPIEELETRDGCAKVEDLLKSNEIVVCCRRGNDSQRAVMKLREHFEGKNVKVTDLIGGLHAWARDVDVDFPVY